MGINYKTCIVLEVRDIENAFKEKYGYDIDLRSLMWPEDYINDSYKSLCIIDEYKDTIWDYKVNHGMIPDDMDEETLAYEYDHCEIIDLNSINDDDIKNKIRVFNLLREYGFGNEIILIDVSW